MNAPLLPGRIEHWPLARLRPYVTGVLACPEMTPPSEWLPEVWGETGEAQFADQKAAEETIGAVLAHYNSVAETITRSLWIEPIYEVDPNSDETLWEPWVDGFTRAMRLRVNGISNFPKTGRSKFPSLAGSVVSRFRDLQLQSLVGDRGALALAAV